MGAAGDRVEPAPSGRAPGAASVYLTLCSAKARSADADAFLAHVLACSLAVAIEETHSTCQSVGDALGLDRAALAAIAGEWFPAVAVFVAPETEPSIIARDEEEAQLLELLRRFRVDDTMQTEWIVSIVTRRAMAPRHLWQDLGLRNRNELSALIGRFFPRLAADNVDNMKWKKFFFRKICELEGFSLCAAPTCGECADFDACFGAEEGDSALARIVNS